ncbi:MAG: hypothetical protein ACRDBH_01945 [Bosea sp. (in: a-proteobacteria)]
MNTEQEHTLMSELKAALDTLGASGLQQSDLLRDLIVQIGQLELAIRDPRKGIANCLSQVFSQACEDGCLAHIFGLIGEKSRTFIEIGVGDGCENTTRLLLTLGWSGAWLEADPVEAAKLRNNFQKYIESGQLEVIEEIVTKENIQQILGDKYKNVDLLSIDIDMNTYHVWKEMSFVNARVVCIEYNASFPPSIEFVVPYASNSAWNRTNWFGASLKSLYLLGQEKRMSLVGCDFFGINAYFVSDDEAKKVFPGPFTPEQHYQPPRYNLLSKRGHPPAPPAISG